MVDPAPQHLIELKQIIYPEVKTKADDLPVSSGEWALSSEQRLTFTVELMDNDSIQDLLIMTPHLYRSSKEGRERAGQLDKLSLTADIWSEYLPPTEAALRCALLCYPVLLLLLRATGIIWSVVVIRLCVMDFFWRWNGFGQQRGFAAIRRGL